MNAKSPLVPPSFLFRFATRCRYKESIWSDSGSGLTTAYRLPRFGELNDEKAFSEFRLAWSEKGISFRLIVKGKRQRPHSNPSRIDASDAVGIWIDTRNTRNIHRASRFCHRFVFMPSGDGRRDDEPLGYMLRIHRAKDDPKTLTSSYLSAKCKVTSTGYTLDGLIPASMLSGFDPVEHPQIGFFYAVTDLELGWNTWFHGPDFPFAEDPSMWGTVELTK